MMSAASAVLVLTLAWNAGGTSPLDLVSVRRLSTDLSKQRDAADEVRQVAAASELALLVDAVVSHGREGVARRDALAYKLLSLGYSAKETADVVSERVSKRALDTAHAMRLVGRSRETVANYLDSQYRPVVVVAAAIAPQTVAAAFSQPTIPAVEKRPAKRSTPKVVAAPAKVRVSPASLAPAWPAEPVEAVEAVEAAIIKYARLHTVDPALIRAVIGAESGFAARARSSAGAIGLMQLMPATARALGVDPHVAEQNIEGGVRYLAELIRTFGGVELALIAYNAGPGLARRYARGDAVLYGETRLYVQQVLARLSAPR